MDSKTVMRWVTGFLLVGAGFASWALVPNIHFIIPLVLGGCGLAAIGSALGIDFSK